jgi:uncharacterized protein YqeY
MVNILENIEEDLKTALKTKDQLKSDVLRMVKTAIKNAEIDKRESLTDNEVVEIFSREVKKRKDASRMYKDGGRDDLALKEEQEIRIISSYLPEQLSMEEIRENISKAIDENSAQGPADFGIIMGKIMPKLKGKADGALVSQVVREELNKLEKKE